MAAMRRKPPYPDDEYIQLCGLHFEDDCFERDFKAELMNTPRRFKLKEDAVPSIFPFSQPKSKRNSSEMRVAKRAKMEIISTLESPPQVPSSSSKSDGEAISAKAIPDNIDELEEPIEDDCVSEPDLDASSYVISSEDDEEYLKISKPLDFEMIFVSWQKIKPLFSRCFQCGSNAHVPKLHAKGATIFVSSECNAGHMNTWNSMEHDSKKNQKKYDGHVAIAASILLSGGTFQPFREAMKIAKVKMFEHNTFYRIQKSLLFPAINNIYQRKMRAIFERTKENSVCLVGDCRCDSPGFSATFGTYTLMNETNNEIIDFFISHVRNAGNSQNMEKYGLKYLLDDLTAKGLNIDTLTTDQHIQIRAFLRKEWPNIRHQFDIWHRSKNMRKKLEKLAKKKSFKELQPWIKAIVNHFWWSCSNCGESVEKLRAIWTSLLYHIPNVHEWSHATSTYTSCAHPPLTSREVVAKKWLSDTSPAYAALQNIVLDNQLMKDLPNLVLFKHSGNIESFHNVLLKYVPKRLKFSYEGMYARTQLAVLDHNSNLDRRQAVTKNNEARSKTQFSKATNKWAPKRVMEPKSRKYIIKIMDEIPNVTNFPPETNEKLEEIPQNISTTPNPGKQEILSKHISRFSKNNKPKMD